MAKSPESGREITRQEAVVRKLQELAHRLGPGAQLPRFLTLREELGVSGTTLTAALNDLEQQGVVVRKHGVGIYVSERLHHRSIALLCNPAFFQGEVSPFWEMLIGQARARAAAKSEDLVLHFTRSPESAETACHLALLPEPLAAEIQSRRVHGILGVGLKGKALADILESKLPFVAFAGYGPCWVGFDEEGGVRLGVEALASRGCRRVALWSAVSSHRPICREDALRRPTITAFQTALSQLNLAFDPALVRTNAHLCPDVLPADESALPSVPSAQEQGRRTALEVFGPDSDPRLRPDGILCTEDIMMQGTLPQLVRLGLRPGLDISIATHANAGSSVLFGYEDTLIRIEASPGELIREMYELLEVQMAGKIPEKPQRCLPPTLLLPAPVS